MAFGHQLTCRYLYVLQPRYQLFNLEGMFLWFRATYEIVFTVVFTLPSIFTSYFSHLPVISPSCYPMPSHLWGTIMHYQRSMHQMVMFLSSFSLQQPCQWGRVHISQGIPLVLRAESLQCAVNKHLVEASGDRNGTIYWHHILKLYSFIPIHTWRLRLTNHSNIFFLFSCMEVHSFNMALELKATMHLIFVWKELIWYFPFIIRKQSSLKSFYILTKCGSALI